MEKDLKIVEEKMLELAEMILDFSKVYRATLHHDKVSPESDTDHTVMLSVMSCAFAKEFYRDLDLGKVSQFATVHDLVEVYAGDTNTINMTEEMKNEKEIKEKDSLHKIKNKFETSFPWIFETIEEYESQKSKEARFVKALDKLLSEMTNILNECQYFKNNNLNKEFLKEHLDFKLNKNKKLLSEFPELELLFVSLGEGMLPFLN